MNVLRKCAVFIFILLVSCYSSVTATATTPCEVHVFVHGTYGTFFSLLSYPYVKKDNLKGTTYLAIQRAMRDTQLVRYRRFSSAPGLLEVTPGLRLPDNEPARYVIGAFSAMQRQVNEQVGRESRYFMFGWSGLLSQQERRREAIRLYNELAQLDQAIRSEGKTPIFNVYGHSHGANVVLNLALVDGCTFNCDEIPQQTEKETIENMHKLLAGAGVADLQALLKKEVLEDSKKWYKRPELILDSIERIILFGVPVQQETAPLVLSPLFKNVLHIYSDNDGIAPGDAISSKVQSQNEFDFKLVSGNPHIKLIRWINNRTSFDKCLECEAKAPAQKSRLGIFNNFRTSRMKILKDGGNPDYHHREDPTHADFWSIGNKRDGLFFEQVPLLIFMPLIYKLLPAAQVEQQLDFCLISPADDLAQGHLFSNDKKNSPQHKGYEEVFLDPLVWARQGIEKILDVNKKLELTLKIRTPFFRKNEQG